MSSNTRLPWGDEALDLLFQFLGDKEATWPISQEKEQWLHHIKEHPHLEESSRLSCRAEKGREDKEREIY